MLKTLDIEEIRHRIIEFGPYEWVNPVNVMGINIESIQKENKEKWFSPIGGGSIFDDEETGDSLIVDYLCDCLSEQIRETPLFESKIDISAAVYIEASIFLICELGSSYAGTHLSMYNTLISKDNAIDCITMLIKSYNETTEPYIKDILRDFILRIFEYGPLWELNNSKYKTLNQEAIDFLVQIFNNGYFTIDKKDARYFSDGRRRFLIDS